MKTILIFSPKHRGNPAGLFLPHPNLGHNKRKKNVREKIAITSVVKIEITFCHDINSY